MRQPKCANTHGNTRGLVEKICEQEKLRVPFTHHPRSNKSIRRENVIKLSKAVRERGWPQKSRFGERPSRLIAAIAISTKDVKAQDLFLRSMKELPDGEVHPDDVVMLKQSILWNMGIPHQEIIEDAA
jgi:hypothetical protein